MPLAIRPSHFYSLLSPSECALRLYLNHQGIEPETPGAFEQVLFRLGQRHEKNHLATFCAFSDLTGKSAEATVEELNRRAPVIYQGTLRATVQIDDNLIEIVGIPDFMIWDETGYVIRDCKISRHIDEARHPEIPRQMQTYGWLFEKITGNRPLRLEVLKGDGIIETLDYAGESVPLSYLQSLAEIISLNEEPYSPVGWSKCGSCGYNELCWTRASDQRDVALVYELDQNLAKRLRELGVLTIEQLVGRYNEPTLSELKRPWGAREQKVGKKAERILLQSRAMIAKKEIILKKPAIPISKNYAMFDLEGLPPQLDELDKIYLWGVQVFGEMPSPFLHSLANIGSEGDRQGWEDFLMIAKSIFSTYGVIPFVHWAPYEKTKIKIYMERYGDIEGLAEKVLSNLVDLLPITREAVVIPEPSYSLKVVEKYVGFKRTQDEYGGDWSIAKYIEAVETDDENKRKSLINEILKYNEEDLQATWAVFDWLKTL